MPAVQSSFSVSFLLLSGPRGGFKFSAPRKSLESLCALKCGCLNIGITFLWVCRGCRYGHGPIQYFLSWVPMEEMYPISPSHAALPGMWKISEVTIRSAEGNTEGMEFSLSGAVVLILCFLCLLCRQRKTLHQPAPLCPFSTQSRL